MTATICSKVNELIADCALVRLICEGGEIKPVIDFLDFEAETYWDRMQFFQEAILYRLVL